MGVLQWEGGGGGGVGSSAASSVNVSFSPRLALTNVDFGLHGWHS